MTAGVRKIPVVVVLLFAGATAQAGLCQIVNANTGTATATGTLQGPAAIPPAPVPPPPATPPILPEHEIKGAHLVQSLRQGGFNLYMRHAVATVGLDGNFQQTPDWWDHCEIQRNISDAGRDQARKVGEGLRALKIPIDQVLTAQFCRTRETGHLLGLGPIEITEDLNHQIGQRKGFDVNVARSSAWRSCRPKARTPF